MDADNTTEAADRRFVQLDGEPLYFIQANCTVCGAAPSSDLYDNISAFSQNPRIKGHFYISQCKSCRTTYLLSQLLADDLSKCYAALPSSTSQPPIIETKKYRHKFIRDLKRLWHYISSQEPIHEIINEGPVLDCGCGSGTFLEGLATRGIHAQGVEFSPESVVNCRSRGLDVELADLSNFIPRAGFYKYIVLSHVIEHVPDPADTLRRLSLGLRHDGALVITTPNVNSAMRHIFGSKWNGWDPPYHLTHFSRRALAVAADKAGLQVAGIRTLGTPDELRRCLANCGLMSGRMLVIRLIAAPIFLLFGVLGYGSHILAKLHR